MNSKTQVQFANEGAEKKQKEEEVAARKRKLEEKEKWEGKSLPTFFIFFTSKSEKWNLTIFPVIDSQPSEYSTISPIHTVRVHALTLVSPFRNLPFLTYSLIALPA